MAALDRGFKSWAERTSLGLRRELGLLIHARLDPKALAESLDVRLWTPGDVPGLSKECRDQLLVHDPSGWSAVTSVVGDSAIIVYNPRHSPGRQNGDITHELAHIVLNHEAARLILSQDGKMVMRSYDRKDEEEADWLSHCLLLPRDGLVWARRQPMTPEEMATHFGVTDILVTYRLRITGVDAQLKAASRRRHDA
jgi:uncharacterized protein DUF955